MPQLSPDLGRHVIADGATVVLKVRQGRHSVILPPRVIALSLSHIPVTLAQGFRLFLTKTLHFGKGRDFIVKALIGRAAVVFVAVVLPDAFHNRINTGFRRSDVPGVPLTAHPLHRLPLSRPETILNAGLHRLTGPRRQTAENVVGILLEPLHRAVVGVYGILTLLIEVAGFRIIEARLHRLHVLHFGLVAFRLDIPCGNRLKRLTGIVRKVLQGLLRILHQLRVVNRLIRKLGHLPPCLSGIHNGRHAALIHRNHRHRAFS